MAGPNPACLVNGTLPPFIAAASSTITISILAPAGIRYWSILCTTTDELNTPAAVNATLSVNPITLTATCTLSAVLGSAYIFTSTVGINGLGLDANSVPQASFTTTFKVNVKASNAAIVLAENETFEQSAAAGWVAVINPALRAGVSVPISVGSTGFVHITSGVFDANARAINLASNGTGGDVTGLLAYINGGRESGDINVTHASPGTFDASHQIAYCDTSTGTCSITFPPASAFGGTIPPDWQVAVVDTAGQALANPITVNPNTETLWDPNGLAFTTSNVTLQSPGVAVIWQWDSNKSHWVVIGSPGGIGRIAPTRLSTATTLSLSQTNIYGNTTSAAFTITMQAAPGDGQRVSFYDDHGQWSTNNLTVSANTGQTILDVQNPIPTFGASTKLIQRYSSVIFEFDGTLSQWHT